jgi:hypothetical protein
MNHLGNILVWFPAHRLRRQYACIILKRKVCGEAEQSCFFSTFLPKLVAQFILARRSAEYCVNPTVASNIVFPSHRHVL